MYEILSPVRDKFYHPSLTDLAGYITDYKGNILFQLLLAHSVQEHDLYLFGLLVCDCPPKEEELFTQFLICFNQIKFQFREVANFALPKHVSDSNYKDLSSIQQLIKTQTVLHISQQTLVFFDKDVINLMLTKVSTKYSPIMPLLQNKNLSLISGIIIKTQSYKESI